MLQKVALAALILGLAFPVGAAAQMGPPGGNAGPPAGNSVAPPDGAMSSHFTSFFTQVLGGHVPSGNVTQQVRTGLTPTLLAQIDSTFTPLGKFRNLQFVSADSMQGYQRYHYLAVFANGSQSVMFIVDSSGAIAGFFQDQPRNASQ
jgi:hypothetical protein